MRAESWVGPVAAIAMLGLTSACGSDVTSTFSVPDATSSDGDQDGGLFTDLDAATLADVSPPEVPDVGLVDGGGPFLCNNCLCDGRTHYCDISSVGPPVPLAPVFGDAGPCPDGGTICRPLPKGCVPASCACLANASMGAGCRCFRSSDGDGLLAGCALP